MTKISPRISFCTTCRGEEYFQFLKENLPKSLKNTKGHNVEFVILAYGDRAIYEWVLENFPEEIRNKRIRVGYTDAPHFKMGHAKNLCHMLATGKPEDTILCNLDADNAVTLEYLLFLQQTFSQEQPVFSKYVWQPQEAPIGQEYPKDGSHRRGIAGRIALKLSDFLKARGYQEETHEGWGFDDTVFTYILKTILNLQQRSPSVTALGETLRHTDATRVKHLSPLVQEESKRRLHNTELSPDEIIEKYVTPVLGRFPNLNNLSKRYNSTGFGQGVVYLNGNDTPLLVGSNLRPLFPKGFRHERRPPSSISQRSL